MGGVSVLSGDEVLAVLDRQTAVMEELAAGAPLSAVLESVVLALEELMPASRCSILLLDEDDRLRHGSAPTLPAAYSAAIDGLVPGPFAGSCGTAVHLGEPVIAVDVLTDRRWEPFRELAEEHGLRACWSSPIRCRALVVGTFAVYHDAPYEPDRRDDELVRRFMHLASLAVEHEQAAKEREARHEADLARQSAERANLAKSQFVTALSHELRTPLQAITGFTENLQTLDLSPDRRRLALDRIGLAAGHILSIVDDVLDLARVEAGAMPIELGELNAHEVIEASVDLIQPLADRRDITVGCSGPRASVFADHRRLRQVILNLLSNAVRFSPTGSTVRVATEVGGDRTRIHVSDQGPGIPDELLARLFVPFDRLGADAGREGGAGLGLVLARRLTEAMNGTLELVSVVGVGTHVTVSLAASRRAP
jgi:two-component system cell cycle sensor histidine kinase PleC